HGGVNLAFEKPTSEPFADYFGDVIAPFKVLGLYLSDATRTPSSSPRAIGILFGVYTVLILLLKLRFHPIANRFDAMFLLESIMMTVRCLSIIASFLAASRRLGVLTASIQNFDAKMPRPVAQERRPLLWWSFYAIAVVYVGFLVRESYLHNVHLHRIGNGYGKVAFVIACLLDYPVAFFWLVCPIPFLVLCQQLTRRFESLQSLLEAQLAGIVARDRLAGNPQNSIENVRLLHAELTGLAELFGSSFGLYLTNYFLFTFLKQLILFYKCLYVTKKFKLIRILLFVQTWVGAFLHSSFSEALMASSSKIIEVLRSCPTTKLPTLHCQEQVLLFTTQLQTAKLTITASELFTVDRQLLTSMIMAVTTYIIVIIQLTPDINLILSRFNLNETAH
ncbi:unnamed protein product, partial [Bemisia tabaci]